MADLYGKMRHEVPRECVIRGSFVVLYDLPNIPIPISGTILYVQQEPYSLEYGERRNTSRIRARNLKFRKH